MSPVAGQFVTETFEYDAGRQVTAYVPPAPPEAIVFAGDGQLIAAWGGLLEAADLPPTMIVGAHRIDDETLRIQEVLDATGYLTASGLAQMPMLTSPQRLADTRVSGGPIGSGSTRCFQVAGQAGIPTGAVAVVLNVTGVGYQTRGWLTVYPAGQSVPATSTVNFDTSEYAIANSAIVRIGGNGQVCVEVGTLSSMPGSPDVALDVAGYLPP
jgi:hypothetical protein